MIHLGIDVGGTKTAAGLVREGRILSWSREATVATSQAEETYGALLEQVAALLADAGLGWEEVAAVGLGFPGDFDPETGVLITAPNLPSFVGRDPRALLAASCRLRFGAAPPVAADNDCCAAVLAEARWGAGRGQETLLYLTVSTGFGGARLAEGRVENLEPGLRLFPLAEDPETCLNDLASGAAIARQARRQMADWLEAEGPRGLARRTSALPPGEGTAAERLAELTAEDLGRAAATGDAFAQQAFQRAADLCAAGIAELLTRGQAARRIVVGGSVALRVEGFLERVREVLASRQRQADATPALRSFAVSELVAAELGQERGILGAVLLTRLPSRAVSPQPRRS